MFLKGREMRKFKLHLLELLAWQRNIRTKLPENNSASPQIGVRKPDTVQI